MTRSVRVLKTILFGNGLKKREMLSMSKGRLPEAKEVLNILKDFRLTLECRTRANGHSYRKAHSMPI